MNVIWRFYLDENRTWKWQRLSCGGELIEESKGAFKEYEKCIANATDRGYAFLRIHVSTRPIPGPRVRR